MTTEPATRRLPSGGVFALVSLLAGGLAGGTVMAIAATTATGPSDALFFGGLGFGAGVILAVFGVVGALVGGRLAARRSESLAVRALGVALGSGILVGVTIAGVGVAPPGAILLTTVIVASLSAAAI